MLEKIPISRYISYYSSKRKEYVPGCIPKRTDFFTEMEMIQNGYYEDLIGQVREITDKVAKEEFKKKNLPSLTVSATCKGWRLQKNMQHYSGILGVDVDQHMNPHISDWKGLRDRFGKKPSVISSFLSASGKGLYFTVRSTFEKHKETFDYILWEMEKTAGIVGDVSGSDYLRLRFISHDPGLTLKTDIQSVPFIQPTPEYYKWRKEQDEIAERLKAEFLTEFGHLIGNESDATYEGMFNKFIQIQETKGKHFLKGGRHPTMVAIAGMCLRYGVPHQICSQLMKVHFSGVAGADDDYCDFAVDSVFKTYTDGRRTNISRKSISRAGHTDANIIR